MSVNKVFDFVLQQHLPLAVLKQLSLLKTLMQILMGVATALTACGIETGTTKRLPFRNDAGCNSTYRLRY